MLSNYRGKKENNSQREFKISTNFYFNNFPKNQITSEQLLVEDLAIEAMQIYGMDLFYLSRSSRDNDGVDYLYGEDTLKQYRNAYPMEMYLENVSGMSGEGDFISKFGLEIRDEITLLVSRRRFKSTVPLGRAREGDLVYIPMMNDFFEITFVENENDQAMYYTLGRGRGANVYLYALKLKKYVFSEEIIETGIQEIDETAIKYYKRTRLVLANTAGTGTYIPTEIVYQGTSLANATAQAVVYSYTPDSSIEVIQVIGNWTSNGVIYGATSNSARTMITENQFSQVNGDVFEDIANNFQIETEAGDILDFSDRNPFGEP
jgi:hypothetical protein